MEKRGIIESVADFREIRALGSEFAHAYLIEKTDRVVWDAFEQARILFDALARLESYTKSKCYIT